MGRLDRYLLAQFMVLFGFFSLVLVGVYWLNRAVSLFDQLIGGGQSAMVFLQFTALTLPGVIRLVMPVSAFVAVVYATNRFLSESELVVMQAAGCSPARLARPVLVFGLLVAAMMGLLMHVLVPASRIALAARSAEIAQNITSRFLVEGSFQHPAAGITLYVREITPQGELRDVFLADTRDAGQETTYTARRALLVRDAAGPKLIMFDGLAQSLQPEGQRLFTTRFADFAYNIGSLISGGGGGVARAAELGTLRLLALNPDDLAAAGQSQATFLAEAHGRFAQPLLATVAGLIGFSTLMLGAFSRLGLWRQILGAVLALIVTQLISNAAIDLAEKDARLWGVVYVPVLFGSGLSALMLWLSGMRRRAVPA